MKIGAWSDGHGVLPKLNTYVDVMIIAGDIVPLIIQYDTGKSLEWFANTFLNYIKKANCKKVILIPGNHDFLFENIGPKYIKEIISNNQDVKDKLVYLIDEEYEYKGLKFYGTPWVTSPSNWAFYAEDPMEIYKFIPEDCDILITHQPPKVDRIGCSYPYQFGERNYGSDTLRNILNDRNIKYHFCGHIHSGIHNGIQYDKTMIFNVAIMNESTTKQVYDITYIEF